MVESLQENNLLNSKENFYLDQRYEIIYKYVEDFSSASYRAKDKTTNKMVLIQRIKNIENQTGVEFLKSTKIMNFFNHETITRLHCIHTYTTANNTKEFYCIFQEISDYLTCEIFAYQGMPNSFLVNFMYQILRGLLMLHSADIVHGNITLKNILIHDDGSYSISGFSNAIKPGPNIYMQGIIGNPRFRSPEINLSSSFITEKADIGSCGITMIELFCTLISSQYDVYSGIDQITNVIGTPDEDDLHFLNKKGANYFLSLKNKPKRKWGDVYPGVDPLALDLLDKMLVFNPNKRWDAEKCLSHPYFSLYHDPEHEPVSKELFDWSFMKRCTNEESILNELDILNN